MVTSRESMLCKLEKLKYKLPEQIDGNRIYVVGSKDELIKQVAITEKENLELKNFWLVLEYLTIPSAFVNIPKKYIVANNYIYLLPYDQAMCILLHEVGHTKKVVIDSKKFKRRLIRQICKQMRNISTWSLEAMCDECLADLYAIKICGYDTYMEFAKTLISMWLCYNETNSYIEIRRNIFKNMESINMKQLIFS